MDLSLMEKRASLPVVSVESSNTKKRVRPTRAESLLAFMPPLKKPKFVDSDCFDLLPLSCFTHIILYLGERGLLDVQLVSKRWFEVCSECWLSYTKIEFYSWFTPPRLDDFARMLSKCEPRRLKTISFVDDEIIDDRLAVLLALGVTHLTSLNLSNCSHLSGMGASHLSSLRNLETLSLHRCVKLAADSFSFLSQCTALTSLDLGLIFRLENSSLLQLTHLTRLKQLEISRCKKLTSEGLNNSLVYLTNLETLDLISCSSLGPTLPFLSALTKLNQLQVARCTQLSDRCLDVLSYLTNLTALDFRSCRFSDRNLHMLASLPKLTTIDFKRCTKLSTQGLIHTFHPRAVLETLILSKCPLVLGHELSAALSPLTALTALDLTHVADLADDTLAFLSVLTNLRQLTVNETHLNGAFLLLLPPSIGELQMEQCLHLNFTDATSHTYFSRLTNLHTLNCTGCTSLTDDFLCSIQNLTQLKTLLLQDCNKLTDAGCTYLSTLTSLIFLDLSNCTLLTDKIFEALKPLTNLATLSLTNNNLIHPNSMALLKNVTTTQ